MKKEKREARAREKLAALLGIQAPQGPIETPRDRENGAQAVVKAIHKPETMHKETCISCGHDFYVDRYQVTCCSEHCVAKALEAIGIDYNPLADRSRRYNWIDSRTGVQYPIIAPVEATPFIDAILEQKAKEAEEEKLSADTSSLVEDIDVDAILADTAGLLDPHV